MAWTYDSDTGVLAHDGTAVVTCYSGFGVGKDASKYEAVHDVGPIPRGRWQIGAAHDTPDHGPVVMVLTPVGHDARGRDGFLIHGDSSEHPGQASLGCIVAPRPAREQIRDSGDTVLFVV